MPWDEQGFWVPDDEEPGLLGQFAHAAWTPIEALLQTLDKPGRAVRGLLSGRPEELANLIPFSDTLGITDPNKSATGRDVLRNFGMIDEEDNWGNFFGGLGTEILLDPLNALTLGTKTSLTAAGKAAKMAEGLAPTAAKRIAEGQAGLMGIRSPWYYDMLAPKLGLPEGGSHPLFTGARLADEAPGMAERLANKPAEILDWATRKVPGVAPARSWFEYGTGFTKDPAVVSGFSGVYPAAEKEALMQAFEPGMAVTSAHKNLIDDIISRGVEPREAQELAGKLVVGVRENANPRYSGIGPVNPELLDLAKPAAESIRELQDTLRQHQRGLGVKVPELDNPFGVQYIHRQSGEGGTSISSAVRSRTIPQTVLPGGSLQHDLFASNPELAGYANRPVTKDTIQELLATHGEMAAEKYAARKAAYEAAKPSVLPQIDEILTKALPWADDVQRADFANQILKGKFGKDEARIGIKEQMDAIRAELPPIPRKIKPLDPTAFTPETAAEKLADLKKRKAADFIERQAIEARDAKYPAGDFPSTLADKSVRKDSREYARFLAELDPKKVDAGKPYYRNDPLGSGVEYANNAAIKSATAKGSLNTLAQEAQPKTAASSNPSEWMSLNKAMNKMGLTAGDITPLAEGGAEVTLGGKKTLLEMLVDAGKSKYDTTGPILKKEMTAELKDKVVPKSVVNNLIKELEGPGKAAEYGLGATAEKVTSAARAAFTTPWIPFHVRNIWDAALQQGLGGGFSPEAIKNTVLYRMGALKDPELIAKAEQIMNEGFNSGAFGRGQAFAQLGKAAVNLPEATVNPLVSQTGKTAGEATKDYLRQFSPSAAAERGESYLSKNPFRIFTRPEESAILQGGNKIHNDIDITNRMSQFWALREQGYSPQAAADIVTQSQLDYSKLTATERKLRQAIPFYSFSKQNMARLAEQLQDPGAVTSLLRAAGSVRQDDAVPNYVSPGSAIPVPGAEEGMQRYMSGFSLPFDDEILGSVLAMASGRPGEAAKRALTAADPLTKLLATLGTGRQIYSGRSLEEATPSKITSFGGLLPAYPANVLSEVLGATPAGRIMSTANSAIAGRDENQLLRLLTGIKTTDVDPVAATNMAARDTIEQLLKRTGMVGVSESLYPKDEYRDVANQPPELQAMLKLLRDIEQQARAAKANRAYQLPTP